MNFVAHNIIAISRESLDGEHSIQKVFDWFDYFLFYELQWALAGNF